LDNGLSVNAKEEAKEMPQAIDNAVEKVERQLKKHKEKIRGHKANANREDELTSDAFDEVDDLTESKIVETRKAILKPMSPEDAILEMDTTKHLFLLFRDASTESICVIYRRDDGRYGLIETNS
jgi:putative sigma-54 modulation protein